MATEAPPDEADDATLVRRIADRQDERALRTLVARYAKRVTGHLRSQFRDQLRHPEIDQAVNDAALKVWDAAAKFDPGRPGGFGPWFLTIAHNCALDLLRGEEDHPELDPAHDPQDHCEDESHAPSPQTEWRIAQMEDIIENELKGLEQIVARADLALGDSADSRRLATENGTTVGSIDTTRSKVRKKIRTKILEREAQQARKKGRQ